MHIFLCFATLHETTFKEAWLVMKPSLLKLTTGEMPGSARACFHHIHLKIKMSISLDVDFPFNKSIKKLTGASFLAETPTLVIRQKSIYNHIKSILKTRKLSTNNHMLSKEVKHVLRQIGHILSTENKGVMRR